MSRAGKSAGGYKRGRGLLTSGGRLSDSKNLRLLWAFPCGDQVPGAWLRHICSAFDGTRHATSMPLVGNQSGTLDLARSWFIQVGRESKQYDWLIQTETNKYLATTPDPGNREKPWANLDQIVAFLEEDRAHGFDAVAGPTISADGLPNFGFATPEVWADLLPSGPIEAVWSGCAFFAISRRCLDGLRILEYAKSSVARDDKPDDPGQPMFCKMALPKEGEDVSLCRNIRESGFRLAIDPRIPVGPSKAFPQFIAREAWLVWRRNAQEALAKRRERLSVAV